MHSLGMDSATRWITVFYNGVKVPSSAAQDLTSHLTYMADQHKFISHQVLFEGIKVLRYFPQLHRPPWAVKHTCLLSASSLPIKFCLTSVKVMPSAMMSITSRKISQPCWQPSSFTCHPVLLNIACAGTFLCRRFIILHRASSCHHQATPPVNVWPNI